MNTTDTTGSVAAAVVVALNGATVSVAVDAAKGSVVVNLSTDDGEQVTLDSEKVERLREALERLNGEHIELAAKYQRMDEGWQALSQRDWKLFTANEQKLEAARKKAHDERMSMARRFVDANQRAYAAERRVRELEARIESMEMDAKVEGYRHG